MGALLAAGLFLAPAGPQAQPYDQDRHGDLKGYLQERTVLIKMSCTPEVDGADAGLDYGQITIEPRISWGSGVLIRNDGYLVTVYHTLGELLQREDRTTTGGQRYTLACDDDDVEIGFYRTDNLASAATGGPVSYPEIPSSRDTNLGKRRDVLFLQANTFGTNNLPHVCSYGSYQTNTTFAGRAITAAGVTIQKNRSPSWRAREGQGSSERGIGEGSNFLLMTVDVEDGMSGGPVVDERGELVGIVHGYRESTSRGATDNLLIPFYLFDDTFRDFAATCRPVVNLCRIVKKIKWNLDVTYRAFVAQANRRDALVRAMSGRLNINEALEYEKFFFQYYDKMTEAEKFEFDQIRAITKGLYSSNKKILHLLDSAPVLLKQVPTLADLRPHLVFWLNKYNEVFIRNQKMAVLYAGVEDEVPFPSGVDRAVADWLQGCDGD